MTPPPGLRTLQSLNGPVETLERLHSAVSRHGMTVLAKIDHGAAADKIGMELRPTVLVLFGNPKTGTPTMQARQTVGIDLPLKALIWQDEEGVTWLGYNEPAWIAHRHGLADDGTLEVMQDLLESVAGEATGR